MLEFVPLNKHMVVEEIKADEKIAGTTLYRPGNAQQGQYSQGIVKAFAACDEARGLHVGDRVLYDNIGAVTHRVGDRSVTTVKVLNIVMIIRAATPEVPYPSEEVKL